MMEVDFREVRLLNFWEEEIIDKKRKIQSRINPQPIGF